MKVHIDSSIRTSGGRAFGRVSGVIEVAIEPHVGDSISFLPQPGMAVKPLRGFAGALKVTTRVIPANSKVEMPSLSLEDSIVLSLDDAKSLLQFYEKGFGLVVDVYNEEDEPGAG